MRSSSLLLAFSVLVACQGPGSEAEGRVLPRMAGHTPSAAQAVEPAGPATAGPNTAAPTSAGPAPGRPADDNRPAGITEASTGPVPYKDVIPWIDALEQRMGEAALRALPRGSNLVDRLRYCYAALRLSEHPRVAEDVEALRAWRGTDPAVLRVYADYKLLVDGIDAARAVYQEAFDRASQIGLAGYPGLQVALGLYLVSSSAPQERERGELLLREEIATGSMPVDAARILAEHLGKRERMPEALRCLEAARERGRALDFIDGLRAKICFHLCRWEKADEILARVVKQHPEIVALGFLHFKIQYALCKFDDAAATLDRLDPLVTDTKQSSALTRNRQSLAQRRAEHGKGPISYSREETFAILRGAPETGRRLEALTAILGSKKVDPESRSLALRVAWNNDAAEVRVAALKVLAPNVPQPLLLLEEGLRDGDKRVRGLAARYLGAIKQERNDAERLLRSQLQREDDGYAFQCVHKALRQLTGKVVALPFGAAETEAGRKAVREAWSKQT